jgi:hypothetical protein
MQDPRPVLGTKPHWHHHLIRQARCHLDNRNMLPEHLLRILQTWGSSLSLAENDPIRLNAGR